MAVRKWVEKNCGKVPQGHVIRYSWSYSTGELVWHTQTGLFRSNFMEILYRKLRLKTHDMYIVCDSVLY